MAQLENILRKPLITEKMSVATEKNNVYGFEVELRANKNQIKQAVETLYNVKVVAVNTNVTPGKVRRAGKSLKKSSSYKKAFVKLAEGQAIQFFKGI